MPLKEIVNDHGMKKLIVSSRCSPDMMYEYQVYLYGATVSSFSLNSDSILYLSKKSILDGTKPIRGGIPIVFPQFGAGELPNHGFARTSLWTLISFDEEKQCVALQLKSDHSSLKLWPYAFTLNYSIWVEMNDQHLPVLQTQLQIINEDSKSMSCQALQHTYLSIPSIDQVYVTGLKLKSYYDKVLNKTLQEEEEEIQVKQETDRIYANVNLPTQVHLMDKMIEIHSRIVVSIHKEREEVIIGDVVIWNPWVDKTKSMKDMDLEDYKQMICVEPGIVSRKLTLPSHAKVTFQQSLITHLKQ